MDTHPTIVKPPIMWCIVCHSNIVDVNNVHNVSHEKNKGLIWNITKTMGHLLWKNMYLMNMWKRARGATCCRCKKIKEGSKHTTRTHFKCNNCLILRFFKWTKSSQYLKCLVNVYNNVSNTLWKHLEKFETNLMNIEYPKTFF
jgi:hypothetical protein